MTPNNPEQWDDTSLPTYLDDLWPAIPMDRQETITAGSPDTGEGVFPSLREHTTWIVDRSAPTAPTLVEFGPGTPERKTGRHRRRSRSGSVRRWAGVIAVTVIAVFALLCWHYLPLHDLKVSELSVTTSTKRLSCGQTATFKAELGTNGAGGTIRYQWLRSDGTRSGVLQERLARGQRDVVLQMKWSFSGQGVRRARATLEVLSPRSEAAAASFVYSCAPTGG
ncbi:hypothetical protein [Streptomyces sp. NPDC060027]|uniref:hypothetical protein n=1 Tax=Streptomyces sp. NPDC060027 TaxID=3347040 RepID=UPI00368EE627